MVCNAECGGISVAVAHGMRWFHGARKWFMACNTECRSHIGTALGCVQIPCLGAFGHHAWALRSGTLHGLCTGATLLVHRVGSICGHTHSGGTAQVPCLGTLGSCTVCAPHGCVRGRAVWHHSWAAWKRGVSPTLSLTDDGRNEM